MTCFNVSSRSSSAWDLHAYIFGRCTDSGSVFRFHHRLICCMYRTVRDIMGMNVMCVAMLSERDLTEART